MQTLPTPRTTTSRAATAPTLTFVGGAGTVTGSKTILDVAGQRLLIDCGLFQGRTELRRANWDPFAVPPESIDAVLVTHAHIDHCGYLPRLVHDGFRGPVLATDGTCRLAGIVLPDSAHLQEEEAAYANRKGYSKHRPALPLYRGEDALAALERFVTVPWDQAVDVGDGVRATWRRAGHILGAASVGLHLDDAGRDVVFSGDLGRPTHPLLAAPAAVGPADVIVCESTYAGRDHDDRDPEAVIAEVVNRAARHAGVVVVPAFAVDRTEVVLWHLDRLVADGRVPNIPVVVDSPMALRALEAYRDAARAGSPELRPGLAGRDLFAALDLREARTPEESRALNERRGPLIIVSASGMATGGRVLHHLAHRLGDGRNEVLLVGFQAPGTRGDTLRRGAPRVKLLGRYQRVVARVTSMELSSHADGDELVDWVAGATRSPEMVYVNHGEPERSAALVDALDDRLGLDAVAPRPGERVRLDR